MDYITNYPDSTSNSDHVSRSDDMVASIRPFALDYAACAAIGVTGGLISTTSTTSNAITLTQKTVVLAADTDFLPGMFIVMAETATPTNYIYGRVDSYTPGTTTLVFTPWVLGGSGAGITAWTIGAVASGIAPVGEPQSELLLSGGNGVGAVDTKIRRFTTVTTNTGSDITYTNTANEGAIITIVTTGLYVVRCADDDATANDISYGVTINESTFLTTDFTSVTDTRRLISCVGTNSYTSSSTPGSNMIVTRLVAGDVLRQHITGVSYSAQSDVMLHITKVGS